MRRSGWTPCAYWSGVTSPSIALQLGAGALGHVQFMPSVYLRYAEDGDGDGRVDLFGSVDDAMVSAGAFLQGLGWVRGERWGREVSLPEGFDYGVAGRQKTPFPCCLG